MYANPARRFINTEQTCPIHIKVIPSGLTEFHKTPSLYSPPSLKKVLTKLPVFWPILQPWNYHHVYHQTKMCKLWSLSVPENTAVSCLQHSMCMQQTVKGKLYMWSKQYKSCCEGKRCINILVTWLMLALQGGDRSWFLIHKMKGKVDQ